MSHAAATDGDEDTPESIAAAKATTRRIHAEYQRFVDSTPILYDSIMNFGLQWPSLSLQWMHDHTQQQVQQQRHQHARSKLRQKEASEERKVEATSESATASSMYSHLLFGTHTSGNWQNQVQLARIRLPDANAFNPYQEFMQHPLASHLNDIDTRVPLAFSSSSSSASAAASSTQRTTRSASAQSAESAAATSSANAKRKGRRPQHHPVDAPQAPELSQDEYTPAVYSYSTPSFEIVSRLRTQHELHRIRPILMHRNTGNASMTQSAFNANMEEKGEMMDTSSSNAQSHVPPASSSTPQSSSFFTSSLIATKGPEATIKIYDMKKVRPTKHEENATSLQMKRSTPAPIPPKKDGGSTALAPLLTLTGHEIGGWPLDWNGNEEAPVGLLASADNNGSICVWNLTDYQTGTPQIIAAPVHSSKSLYQTRAELDSRRLWKEAHESIINDISWLKMGSTDTFFTVGDDCQLKQWDMRAAEVVHKIEAHQDQVSSVNTAPHRPHELLTASKDKTIRLWDIRQMTSNKPLHSFEGHADEVLQVTWAPFNHHNGSIFASSSADRRIFIWDASLIGSSIDELDYHTSGPPELMFVHYGHTERVEDFSWHPTRDWVLASVGEENVVQIWEMNRTIHEAIAEQDQPIYDAISTIMQSAHENASGDKSSDRVQIDFERILETLPEELHSAMFTAITSQIDASPMTSHLADYVNTYAKKIDANLTSLAASESIATMALDESPESDSSVASSSAPSSRSGSVSPPPKRQRKNPVRASVKLRPDAVLAIALPSPSVFSSLPPEFQESLITLRDAYAAREANYKSKTMANNLKDAIKDILEFVPDREEEKEEESGGSEEESQDESMRESEDEKGSKNEEYGKRSRPTRNKSKKIAVSSSSSSDGTSDDSDDEPLLDPKQAAALLKQSRRSTTRRSATPVKSVAPPPTRPAGRPTRSTAAAPDLPPVNDRPRKPSKSITPNKIIPSPHEPSSSSSSSIVRILKRNIRFGTTPPTSTSTEPTSTTPSAVSSSVTPMEIDLPSNSAVTSFLDSSSAQGAPMPVLADDETKLEVTSSATPLAGTPLVPINEEPNEHATFNLPPPSTTATPAESTKAAPAAPASTSLRPLMSITEPNGPAASFQPANPIVPLRSTSKVPVPRRTSPSTIPPTTPLVTSTPLVITSINPNPDELSRETSVTSTPPDTPKGSKKSKSRSRPGIDIVGD